MLIHKPQRPCNDSNQGTDISTKTEISKKFDSCEAGSLTAHSSDAPETLSAKCEVELDEEEGSSKPPEGCNEAENV